MRDLGSTNGTWINGQRVISGRLRTGDQITISDVGYRLDFTDSFIDEASLTVFHCPALVACR